ncbi:uncharacterized protein LOC115412037 [Sphaeramia orbicularis]|uniref:uncharacterized protein LOC115412037 n=1 Tax=Sphaeramia orbicularis TaxID=375764 RepID=UPI001181449C|nr:uncharacterized protein LOC115412037 [Sphaeramia orbicularis]
MVQQTDAGKPDLMAMRTIVLRGLPVLLGDDPDDFYHTCFDCDTDETWAQVSVGVLTVVHEDVQLTPNQLHLHPLSTAIIVEGGIVMDNLQNLPEALCPLFGLSYALHSDYPNATKNTFGFIQRVMLGLGENKLPPKLQGLKNLLLRWKAKPWIKSLFTSSRHEAKRFSTSPLDSDWTLLDFVSHTTITAQMTDFQTSFQTFVSSAPCETIQRCSCLLILNLTVPDLICLPVA